MTDTQYLIGGVICGAFTLWVFAGVWSPKMRRGFNWDGTNRRSSAIGHLGWSLLTAAVTVVLVASGLHYTPITSRRMWILGLGFLLMFVAFIYDHIDKET